MAQSNASNVTPIHGGGILAAGTVAPNFTLHVTPDLLVDFEPKGAVARRYGAYRATDGFCERALFVIDKNGVISWSYCSPVAVNPGADGILQALEELPK